MIRINTIVSSLDKRITIEKAVKSETSRGRTVKEYETLKECFANVYYNSGSISYNERYSDATSTITFTIRYDSDVDYDCRILYLGKSYKIDWMEPLDGKAYWKIITQQI